MVTSDECVICRRIIAVDVGLLFPSEIRERYRRIDTIVGRRCCTSNCSQSSDFALRFVEIKIFTLWSRQKRDKMEDEWWPPAVDTVDGSKTISYDIDFDVAVLFEVTPWRRSRHCSCSPSSAQRLPVCKFYSVTIVYDLDHVTHHGSSSAPLYSPVSDLSTFLF